MRFKFRILLTFVLLFHFQFALVRIEFFFRLFFLLLCYFILFYQLRYKADVTTVVEINAVVMANLEKKERTEEKQIEKKKIKKMCWDHCVRCVSMYLSTLIGKKGHTVMESVSVSKWKNCIFSSGLFVSSVQFTCFDVDYTCSLITKMKTKKRRDQPIKTRFLNKKHDLSLFLV